MSRAKKNIAKGIDINLLKWQTEKYVHRTNNVVVHK